MNFKRHPRFQDALRKLTPGEKAVLRHNLLEEGRCLEDLTIWQGWLVDGYHRAEVIEELGWKAGEQYFLVELDNQMTEDEVVDWIHRMQAGRRNQTPEERDQELYQVYLKLKADRSSYGKVEGSGNLARDTASHSGVSESTAEKAIAKGKLVEQLPPIIQAKHRDGSCKLTQAQMKKILESPAKDTIERSLRVRQCTTTAEAYQKATGRKLASKAKQGPQESSEENLPTADAMGHPISKKIGRVFADTAEFGRQIRALNAIIKWLGEVTTKKSGAWINIHEIGAHLGNAKSCLQEMAPYAVCPTCKGKGCKEPTKDRVFCDGHGWLPKPMAQAIVPERWEE